MTSTSVDLVIDVHATVGEGPVWDSRDGVLLWVDILQHNVHSYNPATNEDHPYQVGQAVGAIVPRAAGGYALAVEEGFALLERLGESLELIAPVERENRLNRMNDGKADTVGRFWAGTMAYEEEPNQGALYRLGLDHQVERILDNVTISNGIGWSLDEKHMYYIDSATHGVDVFDYDAQSGRIVNRRRLIDIAGPGVPDGMTVDAEGYLWVAFYGGSAVHRYSPDGQQERVVQLPVSQVTSCAFGGPRLDDLYITSAAQRLSPAELTEQPLAGALFVYHPGVQGIPTNPYRG